METIEQVRDIREASILKFVNSEGHGYVIRILRTGNDILYLSIVQKRRDGDSIVLKAKINDTAISGNSINNVELSTFVGTRSIYDKLFIRFFTRDDYGNILYKEKDVTREDVLEM